jgi:hypothetical protein
MLGFSVFIEFIFAQHAVDGNLPSNKIGPAGEPEEPLLKAVLVIP